MDTSEATQFYSLSAIVGRYRERINRVLDDYDMSTSDKYAIQCHLSAMRVDVAELIKDMK